LAARLSSKSADRSGVAGLTGASMMSEGTKTRSGDDLSNALQLLGTNVSVGVGSESGAISFVSTTARFADTLGILADMLMNSTFPPEALETAARAAARRARAGEGAAGRHRVARVSRVLYGDAHPLGQSPTERSYKAITRADVVDFHQRFFSRARAGDGRGRRHARGDSPRYRAGPCGLDARGRASQRSRSGAARFAADDDLSNRQAGRRAVDVCDRPAGAASHDARLLRAAA
jgi:hypothetical protein